jgi:hypothetical protein
MKSSFDLLFGTPKELEFLEKEFDFKLDPDHFIKWLAAEGQEITGDYRHDVGSMCEYSCLYIAMLLSDKQLKGNMKIYYGDFGFFEHYWIGYTIDGIEYFIDLTLQQFDKNAPKLAIVKAINEKVSGCYSYLSEGESPQEYLKRKEAFKFYSNPITMAPAPYKIPEFKLNTLHLNDPLLD